MLCMQMIFGSWHQVQWACKKMLDVCFDFNLRNDIMFNPVKSVCVTFKPKNSKLSCPSVSLDSTILEDINQTKCLGFMFNTNAQDDEDMLRQMRTLYIRSNALRITHFLLLQRNVQCMLILVLTTLKQLLENQHLDSYND